MYGYCWLISIIHKSIRPRFSALRYDIYNHLEKTAEHTRPTCLPSEIKQKTYLEFSILFWPILAHDYSLICYCFLCIRHKHANITLTFGQTKHTHWLRRQNETTIRKLLRFPLNRHWDGIAFPSNFEIFWLRCSFSFFSSAWSSWSTHSRVC